MRYNNKMNTNTENQVCGKCKVYLPVHCFSKKRTGKYYKVCNKCRKIEVPTNGPLDMLVEFNNYTRLDEKGNVYLDKRPKDYFTAGEFMLMCNVPSTFFNFKFRALMSKADFADMKSRKGYLISIAKTLSRFYRRDTGNRPDRVKKYRSKGELINGVQSTGCVYPPQYQRFIFDYLTKNPAPGVCINGLRMPN